MTTTEGVKITGNYVTEDNNTGFKTDSSGHMLFMQGGASLPGGRIEVRGGNGGGDIRFGSGSESSFTERCRLDSSGQFRPAANNTYDLGNTATRWRNAYVNDMHFSNEGSSNSIDGTWGDWTLQEGEDKIFMINNRTGKKYSLKMEEE